MLALRLLRGYVGDVSVASYPLSWGLTKYAGNPVIDVADNPSETTEQYVPAALQLGNGDIWCYVKGADRIYAWKSADAGLTFTLQNGGAAVIAPVAATWESSFTLEPAVVYDAPNSTIHLYWKGRAGTNTWAWGHATAADSNPAAFTRDPANPILTSPTVATALGGSSIIQDLAIGDVVKIGSVFHFYGYVAHGSRVKLLHAQGSTWNDPGTITSILTAPDDNTVVETPCVVRIPGGGPALYVCFYAYGGPQPDPRWVRAGTSSDGVTWDFSDTTDIISPGTGWEADEAYSGHVLKESVSPWLSPLIDGLGRWKYYYSGLGSGKANSGLAYFVPVY